MDIYIFSIILFLIAVSVLHWKGSASISGIYVKHHNLYEQNSTYL